MLNCALIDCKGRGVEDSLHLPLPTMNRLIQKGRNKESLKKAQQDNIENVAGSI
jgi:hypothetical protein